MKELEEISSIVILNEMAERGEIRLDDLAGRLLLDPYVAYFTEDAPYFLEKTNIDVKACGLGLFMEVTSRSGIPRRVHDTIAIETSRPVPPSSAELPSRFVLRKADNAVLGILFAGGGNNKYYLIPVSGIFGPQEKGFVELDPEHSSPNRPVFRFGPPDKSARKIGVFSAGPQSAVNPSPGS